MYRITVLILIFCFSCVKSADVESGISDAETEKIINAELKNLASSILEKSNILNFDFSKLKSSILSLSYRDSHRIDQLIEKSMYHSLKLKLYKAESDLNSFVAPDDGDTICTDIYLFDVTLATVAYGGCVVLSGTTATAGCTLLYIVALEAAQFKFDKCLGTTYN